MSAKTLQFAKCEMVLSVSAILLTTGLVGMVPSMARAENEAVAFGVDNFEGPGECSVGGAKDTSYSEGTADKFDGVFDDWVASGDWDQSDLYLNKGLDAQDVSDSTKVSWGNDTVDSNGIDHADVGLMMTHATFQLTGSPTSIFQMGDASGNSCQVDTAANMLFGNSGDNDLEVVIASACQSAQKEVWDAGGYSDARTSTGNMNTWLGFHGDLVAGIFYSDTVKNFVEDSYTEGLGENWVDRLYSWNVFYEVCPVAIIWADSKSNLDSVHIHGGMADRDNDGTGSKTWSSFRYVGNCNPTNGSKLPK